MYMFSLAQDQVQKCIHCIQYVLEIAYSSYFPCKFVVIQNRISKDMFASLQVVAPVRETCAQTLGTVLRLVDASTVLNVVQLLLQLLTQQQWEIRHGGFLALKYLLSVRQVSKYRLSVTQE